MPNTRELSQLASLININDETKSIRVLVDQPDAKIGVGTENPSAKVDISGDVNVSGVITATSFYGDGSNLSNIISGVGIQSAGVTIGTGVTTLNFIGAGNTFAINGNVVDISIAGGGGGGLSGVSAGSTVADDTSTDETFFPVFTQQTSGTITDSKVSTTKLTFNPSTGTLTATDINSTSDINLKENIRPIENSLDKVLQINGVEFDWKDNQQSSMGVIAQEIEKVFPSLVKTAENKSVNYNGLVGVLIEAMKEQQKQIEELKKLIQDR
jgi:hypothetical protein